MKAKPLAFGLLLLSAMARADGTQKPERPRLVRQIGIDFKNVFTTRENLVTVGVGLGAALVAWPFDQEIAWSDFNSTLHEETALDEFFDPGKYIGGSLVQVGGAFATYGLGKAFHRPGVELFGRDLVRAQVVTQSLTLGVKLLVRRERPDGSNQASFPSGHASGTFATATVLQRHYGWKAGVPAYAVAGYVAASRLNEGRHYLSDVVFGAAVGILVGRTVTLELAHARFEVCPTLPPGGVGVQFMWLGSSDDLPPPR
jgi:membrane-associated phospholipid phosphatase